MKNIKVRFQPFNHIHKYLNINLNRLKEPDFSVSFNRFQPVSNFACFQPIFLVYIFDRKIITEYN